MKQGLARQSSRHRNDATSVIHLPPPNPAVVAELIAADAAMASSEMPEPPVAEQADANLSPSVNTRRQARRRAPRGTTKMSPRVEGETVSVAPQTPPVAQSPAPLAADPKTDAAVALSEIDLADFLIDGVLPHDRSQALNMPRGLTLVADRLRATFGLKRREAASPPTADAMSAERLEMLRDDLKALQQSVAS